MGVFRLCAEVDVWDAVYGAVCAYAVQHLSYAAHSFIALSPELAFRCGLLSDTGLHGQDKHAAQHGVNTADEEQRQ